MNNRTELTIQAAEVALKELLAEGAKISQYAVERRAGLANGALNYKSEKYTELKSRIQLLKHSQSHDLRTTDSTIKQSFKNESRLKNKYRKERDNLKKENQKLHAHNKELLYQLWKIQQHIQQVSDSNVFDFHILTLKPKDN
ncbi:hypothetical protein [Vibrio splendidus]|uniref:hypothetical protein n=1 Tax=Vibrio splendidus TaxID=29497 RepID=UPI003D0D0CF5